MLKKSENFLKSENCGLTMNTFGSMKERTTYYFREYFWRFWVFIH